jgi:hypothetical protein
VDARRSRETNKHTDREVTMRRRKWAGAGVVDTDDMTFVAVVLTGLLLIMVAGVAAEALMAAAYLAAVYRSVRPRGSGLVGVRRRPQGSVPEGGDDVMGMVDLVENPA